jgi:hypothetical protein
VDYKDFDKPPEKTAAAVSTAVRQSLHLARTLKAAPYPA